MFRRAAFFCVLLGAACSPASAKSRPNVLLICVDDLKPTLGCYGDQLAVTPNIDALAAKGLRFDRAYCNQAVCSPSRNALLVGMRPQTIGIYDLATNFRVAVPDAITLPQWFKQHGYRTEGLGKIYHTGHGNHDDKVSWSTPHWARGGQTYVKPENRPAPVQKAAQKKKSNANGPQGAAVEAADVPDDTYADGLIADEAVRRLQAAAERRDEPFFLAVGFIRPHLPFVAPQKYWDLYDRSKLPLAEVQQPPEGAPDYAPQFGGELRQYEGIPAQGALPELLQRELIHGYYAATSYMDAQLGRVMAELNRLQLADETIVVLWGDHGWHLGDHGIWCKHTNYEQAARIPLIIVAPQSTSAGQHTMALAESVDIYPTLCELAGLPLPTSSALDGKSLVPVLRDPQASVAEAIYHAYPRSPRGQGAIVGRAVRTERYRLVEWKKSGAAPETAELELYDYQTDPLETRNLANSQPEVVARLRQLLARVPEAKPQVKSNAN